MTTFLFQALTLWCNNSFESSLRDDSKELSHHMFLFQNKVNIHENVSIIDSVIVALFYGSNNKYQVIMSRIEILTAYSEIAQLLCHAPQIHDQGT